MLVIGPIFSPGWASRVYTKIDFTRPLADKKNLDVRVTLPPEPPTMHSDAGKILQIIYNLMSNAIKFTPPEGRIDILIEARDEDHIQITVNDTGPGIHREQQEAIFDKFRQLDGSVTREFGGTGLGLAISRDLAVMLGGNLSVRSEEGSGSEFVVSLPTTSPKEADMPVVRLN